MILVPAGYSYSMNLSRFRHALLPLVLLWLGITSVAAQADPYAFVIYAEGYNMSVYRNGELETYDVLVDDVIGMPLLPGDLVQTDADTFVEMQVMPSRTVVKVAENTTFEIESLGGAGGGSFNMSYGRLRARVERITSNETFQVRGFSAVAGVRGTDFGYDVVVEREAAQELQTRVYVFEGEVEVTEAEGAANAASTADGASGDGASDAGAADGQAAATDTAPAEPQRVLIRANEMVNVVSAVPASLAENADQLAVPDGAPDAQQTPTPAPQKVVFLQQALQDDIQQFWNEKTFQEDPIDPADVEKVFPGINARVEQLTDERRQYEELQRLRREGLLDTTDELLSDATQELEPMEPEREPEPVALGEPGPNERIRRLIQPQAGESQSQQLRRAGHWFLGTGLVLEAAGAATAWYGDGVRTIDDVDQSGPAVGMMAGGGVFITSAIFSYLFSLIGD